MRINQNRTLQQKLKAIQARFFNGNVLAQKGNFLTKQDVDELRKEVTKPFISKKLKRSF
ncbi:MAG: hypothetical protein ACJAZX_000999 [Rickettsiales bacterium]|jgi:hypothetical protein